MSYGTDPCPRDPGGGTRISRRTALGALALICGAGLVGVGMGSIAHEDATARSYERLARSTRLTQAAAAPLSQANGEVAARPQHDWDSLQVANSASAAWLTVGGTDIDLPVVATRNEDEQDWYLAHDLWGRPSASGTPFMDWRCIDADARHTCVYAHHMTSTSGMFTQLQDAYEQEKFDALGSLIWETPGGIEQAAPLCALRVDASWQAIQRFDWGAKQDEASFICWLEGIVGQADALSGDVAALLDAPRRCFTLVTCASDFAMQRWRTLALWVH